MIAYPELLRAARGRRRRRPSEPTTPGPSRSPSPTRPRWACSRAPGRTRGRRRGRRRPSLSGTRCPTEGPTSGFRDQARARAPGSGPDRGRDPGRRRTARLRPHAPSARATHPAREGDLERVHQPDAHGDRGGDPPGVARPGRACRRLGELCARRTAYRRRESARDPGMLGAVRRTPLQRVRPRDARRRRRAASARSPDAGSSSGPRSAAGSRSSTNCLLVSVTEKRTRGRHRSGWPKRSRRSWRSDEHGRRRSSARPARDPLEDPFPLVFELSRPGRRAWSLPEVDVDAPPSTS